MKQLLLSLATVAIVGVGAMQLVRVQECEVLANDPVYSDQAAIFHSDGDVLAPTPLTEVPELAQATSPPVFGGDLSQPTPLPSVSPVAEPEPVQKTFKRTIRVPRVVYETRVVEMGDVTEQQQQFSFLMLRKAQRMSKEDLAKAIQEVQAELREQDDAADVELQKAVEILEKLTESTGTPAARRALQALPVLKAEEAETVSPGGSPYLDDGFAPSYPPDGAGSSKHTIQRTRN